MMLVAGAAIFQEEAVQVKGLVIQDLAIMFILVIETASNVERRDTCGVSVEVK